MCKLKVLDIKSRLWQKRKYCVVKSPLLCRYNYPLFQRVQNAAARVVTFSSKLSHVTPVHQELQWLPVRFCISFNPF